GVGQRGALAGRDRKRRQTGRGGARPRLRDCSGECIGFWRTEAGAQAMTLYFLVKYLHVLGAIVILGTGSGIAFFMLMADLSRDTAFIARTAGTVVVADVLFTLTAV